MSQQDTQALIPQDTVVHGEDLETTVQRIIEQRQKQFTSYHNKARDVDRQLNAATKTVQLTHHEWDGLQRLKDGKQHLSNQVERQHQKVLETRKRLENIQLPASAQPDFAAWDAQSHRKLPQPLLHDMLSIILTTSGSLEQIRDLIPAFRKVLLHQEPENQAKENQHLQKEIEKFNQSHASKQTTKDQKLAHYCEEVQFQVDEVQRKNQTIYQRDATITDLRTERDRAKRDTERLERMVKRLASEKEVLQASLNEQTESATSYQTRKRHYKNEFLALEDTSREQAARIKELEQLVEDRDQTITSQSASHIANQLLQYPTEVHFVQQIHRLRDISVRTPTSKLHKAGSDPQLLALMLYTLVFRLQFTSRVFSTISALSACIPSCQEPAVPHLIISTAKHFLDPQNGVQAVPQSAMLALSLCELLQRTLTRFPNAIPANDATQIYQNFQQFVAALDGFISRLAVPLPADLHTVLPQIYQQDCLVLANDTLVTTPASDWVLHLQSDRLVLIAKAL